MVFRYLPEAINEGVKYRHISGENKAVPVKRINKKHKKEAKSSDQHAA